jgi:hypothetical protein
MYCNEAMLLSAEKVILNSSTYNAKSKVLQYTKTNISRDARPKYRNISVNFNLTAALAKSHRGNTL